MPITIIVYYTSQYHKIQEICKSNVYSISGAAAAAAKSLQSCPTLCDPIDGSPPGSPILGFSRQEHWSGLPFPFPISGGKYVKMENGHRHTLIHRIHLKLQSPTKVVIQLNINNHKEKL